MTRTWVTDLFIATHAAEETKEEAITYFQHRILTVHIIIARTNTEKKTSENA